MIKILHPILRLDASLSNHLRLQTENRLLWGITAILAHSGDSWLWLAGLLPFWLFGGAEWHNRINFLAGGIVFLAILVLGIKFVIRRQRPPGEWGAIYRNTDPHSFPSGHAARAGLLIVMTLGLGPLWLAILLIIWAPFMSLARIAAGVHYLSDVLAGFLLGIGIGAMLLQLQPVIISWFPYMFY
jgi:undecaprenyl-diphosphatase